MNLDWLRDLEHLSQTGNFSRAAKLSHLSQPAFSRRIKALEDWVGAALVDRSRQPVHLLAAGEQIMQSGRVARDHLENERRYIREALNGPARQIVTFAVPHSIGWRFFPDWLNGLEDSFGPFSSSLRVDDIPRCLEALDDEQADFVLSYESEHFVGFAADRRLVSLQVGRDELIPVSKPDGEGQPLHALEPERENEQPLPWLRFGVNAPMAAHLIPVVSSLETSGHLQVVYENSMASTLRIRARDGAGIAWLPRSLVSPDLTAGLLVVAGPRATHIPLTICLYRHAEQSKELATKLWAYLTALDVNEAS